MQQVHNALEKFRSRFSFAEIRNISHGGYHGLIHHKQTDTSNALAAPTEGGAALNLANTLFPAWGSSPDFNDEYDSAALQVVGKVSASPAPALPSDDQCRSVWEAIDLLNWRRIGDQMLFRPGDKTIILGTPVERHQALHYELCCLGGDIAGHHFAMARYAEILATPNSDAIRRSALWTWLLVEIARNRFYTAFRAVVLLCADWGDDVPNEGDTFTFKMTGGPQDFADVPAWAEAQAECLLAEPKYVPYLINVVEGWAEWLGRRGEL